MVDRHPCAFVLRCFLLICAVCVYVQRQVADARSLPMAVVESHLLQVQKAGQPLDTEHAGLSTSLFNTITRILSSTPLSSGNTQT